MKVSLMYKGFLPIHTEYTFDLCELLQDMKKSCPVPKGIFDITMDTKVPMDVLAVSRRERVVLILNNSLASFSVILYANSVSKHNKSHCSNLILLQGYYSGNGTATDQNNQEIFCINFNYKF